MAPTIPKREPVGKREVESPLHRISTGRVEKQRDDTKDQHHSEDTVGRFKSNLYTPQHSADHHEGINSDDSVDSAPRHFRPRVHGIPKEVAEYLNMTKNSAAKPMFQVPISNFDVRMMNFLSEQANRARCYGMILDHLEANWSLLYRHAKKVEKKLPDSFKVSPSNFERHAMLINQEFEAFGDLICKCVALALDEEKDERKRAEIKRMQEARE